MTDKKIVTHADLNAIGVIENECSALPDGGLAAELLRRLRAAAEADAPPLPEGWVLADGMAYWHKGGVLFAGEGQPWVGRVGEGGFKRSSFTPLRPTITEADVEKAALCFYEDGDATPADWPVYTKHDTKANCRDSARAILKAAGVEVAS